MPKFGDVLFGGSRFMFWALSPVLLLFAIGLPWMVNSWSAKAIAAVAVLESASLLLILVLYDSGRFWWARRVLAAIVFLFFVVYCVDTSVSGKRKLWEPVLGLIAIGLPCLRYVFVGRFGREYKVVLGIERFLVGACPNCGKPLNEHDRANFASTVASEDNKPRLTEFFESIKKHDWCAVSRFNDFDATKDDMEVYAVRCASGGVVFVFENPFELYESDELYCRETVSAAEMLEIESLVSPTSWQVGGPDAAK